MIICVCAFSKNGYSLAEKLKNSSPDTIWELYNKDFPLENWLADCFSKRLPIIFIGAAGIAVRKIAPFVKDKLTDSPVIVLDETGTFVIPLLSGHAGSANEISRRIAALTGGTAVITTATDVQKLFSVDVFAVKNGFYIENREGIKKISSKLLENQTVSLWIDPEIQISDKNIPEQLNLLKNKEIPSYADLWISAKPLSTAEIAEKCLLNLSFKAFCAGIGCKKGKTFEELQDFLSKNWKNRIFSISTIDLKKNEKGLVTLAQFLHAKFNVFTAEELQKAEGSFSDSEFVEKTTGVANVCERAAILAAGKDGKLVLKKTVERGMTLAIAERKPIITTWETN